MVGRSPGWHWEGRHHHTPFHQTPQGLASANLSIITFGRLQSDQEALFPQLALRTVDLVLIDEAQQTQTPDSLLLQAGLEPSTVVIRVGDTQQSPWWYAL